MAFKSTLFLLASVAQLSLFCQALDCGCGTGCSGLPRIYNLGDCGSGLRTGCGCQKKCGDTIIIKEPTTVCGSTPAIVASPYYGGYGAGYYGVNGPYGCGCGCGSSCGGYVAGYPYNYGYNTGYGCGYGSSYGCGSTCGCGCGCGKSCGDTIVIKEPTCRCSTC